MDDEQVAADPGHHQLDPGLRSAEPVVGLAAVQHQLQADHAEAEGEEAEQVELRGLVLPLARHEEPGAEEGHGAHRDVDEEAPAPAVVLGQPAAQGRAEDRAQHHRAGEGGHGLAVALGRIDIEQGGLGQRDQGGARHPLDEPEGHDLAEALGRAAHGRRQGEAGHREQEHGLAAQPIGQPAGQRRHDRGGDDVEGQDPGDLVLRGRHRALDVGQGDVGDGGVQRLHQGRGHDGDRDEPRVRNLPPGGGGAHPLGPNRRRL